jgi:hypothetical protein
MAEHVVSDDILNNMGSLEGLLSERGYTTATVPMQGETIVRNEFGPGAAPVPAEGFYAPPGVVPQGAPGVVPGASYQPQPAPAVQPYLLQQQPVVRQQPAQNQISREQYDAALAYAGRMQQAAEEKTREKLEAEDKAFMLDLDQRFGDDQVAKDREVLIRYTQQLQSANESMYETMQERAERQEAQEQLTSKYEVAEILATGAGIPWELPGIQQALMNAPTMESMESIVAGLSAMTPRQQQSLPAQPTPAQLAGQIVAAPGRGSSGRAAPAVKPGSGDILGLLKTRGYALVAE